MDHLPLPSSTPWKHVSVPLYTYANGQRYTYSPPWETYDIRQEYNPDSALHLSMYDNNEDAYPESLKPQMASFVQAWLWFGVLSEILQFPPDSCAWIDQAVAVEQQCDFECCVTTKNLLSILDSWCHSVRNGTDEIRTKILARTDRVLFAASQRLGGISFSWTNVQKPNSILPQPLLLSIQLLLATLRVVRNITFVHETPFADTGLLHYDILLKRMRDDGWCPSEIQRVQSDTRLVSQYCISFLGPVRNQLDHSCCNPDRCNASQIDHATYQTRHNLPACQCGMITNTGMDVARILGSGRIPVLRLQEAGDGINLDSVSLLSSKDEIFVAISHVWSDGLGNLDQNSLPLCQLQKIQIQVNALMSQCCQGYLTGENVNFWIDTICVPVGVDLELERSLAIAQMKEVYRNAYAVLVLSAELEDIPSTRSPWELAARINRTSWFRRLWTLHEGVLSRKSVFQLADRAVEVDELAGRLPEMAGSVNAEIHNILFHELSTPHSAMEVFKRLPAVSRSQQIWTAVHSRSTSNLEDETICLANMLELDLAPILSIDRKDQDVCGKRMQAFIIQQRLFPQVSPFYARGMKELTGTLTYPGFRWAPKSFVFRNLRDGPPGTSPLVSASKKGLHVSLPGISTGGDWTDFLGRIQETGERLKEVLDPRFVIESREVKFMLPFRWDESYILSLSSEFKSSLTDDIRRSTLPAILLEKDLVNEEIDMRQLRMNGQRVRAFHGDCPRTFDINETWVSGGWCRALVVAVPLERHSLSSAPCDATVLAFATFNKNLFDESKRPVWSQLFFPSSEKAMTELGCFDALPATTTWCLG